MSASAELYAHAIIVGPGENWLTGWGYRKRHVVNQQAGAGANYQIAFKAYYGAGADGTETLGDTVTAGKVYCEGKCRTDFADIHFTEDDGDTELEYWLEEKIDSNYAIFWVKITGDLSAGNHTIYVYYGNAGASSSSDIDATFLHGDNFTWAPDYSASNPLFNTAVMPNVIKEGIAYWIYVGDVPASRIKRRVGTDETTWGAAATTGIVSKYCTVSRDGATWRMIYANLALTELRLATSNDGLTFTDQGVVLSLGAGGQFDDTVLSDPNEIKVDGIYYLYYVGGDGVTTTIGLATSATGGVGTYTRRGQILAEQGSGWENVALFDPYIVEYDTGKWMLWYSAHGDGVQRLGYATTDDLTAYSFDRSTGNPVFWPAAQEWENPNVINELTVLIEDSKYKIWYRGSGNNSGEIGYLTFDQDPITKLPTTLPMLGDYWHEEGGWSIDSGTKKNTQVADYAFMWDRVSFTNIVLEFILNRVSGTWSGGIWRVTDKSNLYLLEYSDGFPYTFKFYKRVANAYTQIGGSVTVGQLTAGVDYLISIRIIDEGGGLRVKADIDRTNKTNWLEGARTYNNGYPGIWNRATGTKFDDLRVRSYVDPEPTHGSWASEEGQVSLNLYTHAIIRQPASAELYAHVVIIHSEDLYAHAIIRQPTSVDLYAHVVIIHSEDLYAHAVIRQPDSADLYASFEAQVSLDLYAHAVIRQPDSADLYASFEVQISLDLYAHAVIRQPTSVDLYAHVEFIRSIELYAHAIIRNIGSAPPEVYGHGIIRNIGSAEAYGHAVIRQLTSLNLYAHVVIIHSEDLYAHAVIRQPASA
ncbi:hypothetical protein LCGC14_1350390, partial [marine sediment metagenome]